METKLRLTGRQYEELRRHLLPDDGKEAVAVALCGRRAGEQVHCLLVREIVAVPHAECAARESGLVTWPTERLVPLLQEAERKKMGVLKIHSHRTDYRTFSAVDDVADRELFSSVYGWLDDDLPHMSAVMLPNGDIFGRTVSPDGGFSPISLVSVVGNELLFWPAGSVGGDVPAHAVRNVQAFGRGTYSKMRRLSAAVIGCSGTGSPLVEQLARLEIGRLLLVDPDRVEPKNMNRIVNATAEDARLGRFKVEVAVRSIAAMEMVTVVEILPENLCTARVVEKVAECDVIFGCMDGAEGRLMLNRLATFYSLPYFDVGVRLDTDGRSGIEQIAGTVNYLQPGGSSLVSRNVITREAASAEAFKRMNPMEYEGRLRDGYLRGVPEDRPAVMPINMHYASLAVLEFLARLHPYRNEENFRFAAYGSSLVNADLYYRDDGEPDQGLAREVGRGDVIPPLDMPSLSR